MNYLQEQFMPSPAPKNIFLGAGDVITHPYKCPPFLEAGDNVIRP
jgi:hypothetical protein